MTSFFISQTLKFFFLLTPAEIKNVFAL